MLYMLAKVMNLNTSHVKVNPVAAISLEGVTLFKYISC